MTRKIRLMESIVVPANLSSVILSVMIDWRKLFQITVIFLLSVAAGPIIPVTAQDPSTLSIDPPTFNVLLGEPVEFNINLTNGLNVHSFDLTISYESQQLSLSSWYHGGFLSNPSCASVVDQPGILELACSQVDQTEVSGNGVLLSFSFDTIGAGFSGVIITEAELADFDGLVSYPRLRHGVVGVTNNITYTPSPTATLPPTGTSTTTPTFIPTASPSPTLIPTGTQMVTPSPSATGIMTSTATTAAYPGDATAILVGTPIFTATPTSEPELPPTQTVPVEVVLPPTEATKTPQADTPSEVPSYAQTLLRGLWRVVLWAVVILVKIAVLAWAVLFLWRRSRIGDDDGLL